MARPTDAARSSARHAYFPDPERAAREPNGLLAVGGDLSPERLLAAYESGIFPWFDDDDEPILWWSPDPRAVLFPDRLHVARSLARKIRAGRFEASMDRAFDEVIDACAAPRDPGGGTWITARMSAAYRRLHELGYAHSVEIRIEGVLAGGLYGVSLGAMFFGESMFSRRADASKLALYHLASQLRAWRFTLIDCQVMNPHLSRLGAEDLPRRAFLDRVVANRDVPTRLGAWHLEAACARS